MSNGCPSSVEPPMPRLFEQDEFVRRRESINERRIPVCTCRAEAIQDQKRSALPDSAINDSSAINRDRWQWFSVHRCKSTISSVASRHENVNRQRGVIDLRVES